jgi:Amt family ammonium transporter
VHINAAVAGLVGAYLIGKRVGFGKEAFKPHNLPMVFTGTAILYFGWFGFNAGSASAANEIAALAFVNTVGASGRYPLLVLASGHRGKPSLLGACSVRLPVWLVSPGVWLCRCRRRAACRSGCGWRVCGA